MTKIELTKIGLQIKEQRVAYWEKNHRLPGCEEMADYLDNNPLMI